MERSTKQHVDVPPRASYAYQLANKDDRSIKIVVFPLKAFKLDTTPFDIHLKTLNGRSTPFRVSADTTIVQLQDMIQDKLGTPPDQQRLVYKNKNLNVSPVRDKCTYTYHSL
jgi:hypothetical protein